ncbi:MAG: hypothetical protein AB7H93_05085 [Vicinamibacterales bacterium]
MAAGLRVAIDLDGTVADLSAAMHAVATRRAARDLETDGADNTVPDAQERPALRDLALTSDQLDQLWATVLRIRNFWTTLAEMEPGAVRRLAELAAARRWDVLFITTRPPSAGATTQVQSQQWLEACGFPCPSVYVVKGSRGKIADALQLDAVVDDRPENCLDVAVESSARPFLVWSGSESELPRGAVRHGVTLVPTINAALDALVELDRDRQGGMGRSLRRLFGR